MGPVRRRAHRREAGARVEGLRGSPAGAALVVAAGPALFGPLHDLLAAHDADRDPLVSRLPEGGDVPR